MNHEPGASAWLTIADNQQTWDRLCESLALADGFELVFAVVVDQLAAAWIMELLEARAQELGRRSVRLDARDADALERLTSGGDDGVLVVLDTVDPSRRDRPALDRCLLELNPRRDLLVERVAGPIVVVTRPDGLRRFADLAPDLFSVHTAAFRLFGGADLRLDERPEWLLADHEFVGLLGIDPSFGLADRSRVPKIVREPPQPPERLFGREELLAELAARLVPGGERVIEISGVPGVGRTALVAQAVALVGERWDRVIWLDCRHVWHWRESDPVINAVIEVLAATETAPFDIEDARERFVELTTLHSVLIVADDHFQQPRVVPGARSCLVIVLGPKHDARDIPPLSPAAVAEFSQSLGLPHDLDFGPRPFGPQHWAALPGVVRLLDRWARARGVAAIDSLPDSRDSDLGGLCDAIVDDAGPEFAEAFRVLLHLSGWIPEFPRGVHEPAFSELERLGVLVSQADCYRFSETGIGRWNYVPRLSHDWHSRLAVGSIADHLFANLGAALAQHELGAVRTSLSSLGLTRDDLERCAASVPPPIRPVVWRSAVEIIPMHGADERICLQSALVEAMRCGQADRARETNDQLGAEAPPLLAMLATLRPTEWDPGIELGHVFASTYIIEAAEHDIAAALRRGLDLRPWFEDDRLPDAAPARVALALRGEACNRETLHDLLATLDLTRELDRLAAHFVWSRLAWLHILANDWPNFERSFTEVERSARAWGISYALVRLRLVELTALEARGDLDRAADKLLATLASVDRCYGTRSRVALALLRRSIRIYTELDRRDDAEQAAEEIRGRRRAS